MPEQLEKAKEIREEPELDNISNISEEQDNLATFGIENLDTVKVEKSNLNVVRITKNNIEEYEPLETPTFYSTRNDPYR